MTAEITPAIVYKAKPIAIIRLKMERILERRRNNPQKLLHIFLKRVIMKQDHFGQIYNASYLYDACPLWHRCFFETE